MAAEAGEHAARDELRGEPLARDEDRQLVAAEPVRLLRGAEGARGDAGDLSEHVVAGRMTVGVVEALEIVQVEEGDAERLALGVRQQLVETLLERAAVRQPGERVAAGLVVRERHAPLVGHGGGRQIGDRCDEPVVELEPGGVGHHREEHADDVGAVEEGRGHRLVSREADGSELGEVLAPRLDELFPAEAVEGDPRRRRRGGAGRGPRRRGEREPDVGSSEIHGDAGPAGQLGDLSGRQLGGSALVGRSVECVCHADQRLRGSGDGALQLPQRRALDAVRGRTRLEHRRDNGSVVGAGERDDAHGREGGRDLTCCLDAVENRHADVHEDHVRRQGEREIDCLLAVARLTDDGDLRLLGERDAQHRPIWLRVVADQQADHRRPPSWALRSPSKKAEQAKTCGSCEGSLVRVRFDHLRSGNGYAWNELHRPGDAVSQAAQADVQAVAVQAAVHDLFERHGERVLAYCGRRLRSQEEAEDALQTTFLYACRGLQRGVVPDIEIAWLLKIAHNVCLSTWDADRRRRRLELVQDPEQLEAISPAAPSGRENTLALEAALGDLSELQRKAILLREWRGLSYREIAKELELSQSAVETLLFRARRTLARSLERQDVARPRTLARCLDFGGLLTALKSALGLGGSAKLAAGLVGVAVLAGSIPDTPKPPAAERPQAAPAAQVSAPVLPVVVMADPVTSPAAKAAVARANRDRRPAAQGKHPGKAEAKKGSQPAVVVQLPGVGETLNETVGGVTDTVNGTVRDVRETVDETVAEILPPVLDLVDGVVGGEGGLLP